MARRVRKAPAERARGLNEEIRVSRSAESTNELQEDEFYARFLTGNPDRKLSYSEILEILRHGKASLDAAARKAGLR